MKVFTSPAECERVLIVKLSSIGDVVMATPVAKALRAARPSAYIAWVVEDRCKDIVVGNPYLDDVIVWGRDSGPPSLLGRGFHFVRGLHELISEIRRRNFEVAIDLQGLLRSALVAQLSGAHFRLGYSDAREGSVRFYNAVLPSSKRKFHGPREYLEMLTLLDIAPGEPVMHVLVGEEERVFADELLRSLCLGSEDAVVALCPATTWPNKHWTEEGWATLADELASAYGMAPLFLGAAPDEKLVDRITGRMRFKAASAVGKTTLKQAAAVLERSRLVVGVDSGPLHMALALDRPAVGVFGPSGWRDFIKKDNFVSVAKDFPCIPCFRHPTCEDFDCMSAITPGDVLAAARRWLPERSGRS